MTEYTHVASTDPPPGRGVPDIVVVGAASRDLARDDPRGWRLGGGVVFSALTTARLGLRTTAIVGVDDEAAAAPELAELRSSGVDVLPVGLAHGPVFENIERPEGRLQIAHAGSDELPPSAAPPRVADAPGWLLVPIAGELPAGWADVPSSAAIVGLGWQGLLRTIEPGRPVARVAPSPGPLVTRADILGLSRDDIDPTTRVATLCRLAAPGSTLLLTTGDDGGVAYEIESGDRHRASRYPALRPDRVVDPTGAGDVMLAAVVAARVRPDLVGGRIAQRFDLLLGAAAASLVVEGPGLEAVPHREAIRQRLREAIPRRTDRPPPGARGVTRPTDADG
jgi:sugar/nucleoside kinase (ribokinase family)